LAVAQSSTAQNHDLFLSWDDATKTLNLITPLLEQSISLPPILTFTTNIAECGAYKVTDYFDAERTITLKALSHFIQLKPNPTISDLITPSLDLKFQFTPYHTKNFTKYLRASTEGNGSTQQPITADFILTMRMCTASTIISTAIHEITTE
jgi:hypothetical protein